MSFLETDLKDWVEQRVRDLEQDSSLPQDLELRVLKLERKYKGHRQSDLEIKPAFDGDLMSKIQNLENEISLLANFNVQYRITRLETRA